MRRARLPDSTVTPVFRANGQTVWQTGSVAASRLELLLSAAPRCGLVVICAAYRPGWTWQVSRPEAAIVPLVDALRGASADNLRALDRAWRLVEGGWRRGDDIVVACELGIYRSAGVILCWLARARGMLFDDALALMQGTRGEAIGRNYREVFAREHCPPDGFFGQVHAVVDGWRGA